jgi:type I restriction enzyme S subunit
LQVFAEAISPTELKEHWQRLHVNFEELFTTSEDVTDFKGLLLDLAVSGKLLSPDQYTTDSTGITLLNEIEDMRIKWAEDSVDQELKEAKSMLTKIRKQNADLPIVKLPRHWQWATFLEVSMAVIDCHNKTAPYVGKGIHLIRTTDIRNGKMDLRHTKKITDDTYDYWSRRMPPKSGDVFFTREAPMGEAAIVPEKEKICLGQRTMLLRLFPSHINNEYLLYVIQSPSFQKRMVEAAVGMTVKHLRVGGVEELFVPVPPKKEQDLIVSILNSFFVLCERLELQLSTKNAISKNLATEIISTLTGINSIQEEAPLKIPKPELIAPIVLGSKKPESKDIAPLASLLARQDGQMNSNDLWQHFGGEIDAFYAQLKTEVTRGWITKPSKAHMLEKDEE